MRLKVDENLHVEVADRLAAAGHDVHTVASEGLRGAEDTAIVERCRAEDRALVTLDLDFADIRSYPPADHPGMIVLRVSNQSRGWVLSVIDRLIVLLESEPVLHRLWVVSESDLRIRS
ncbi:MAG: DUF5615 family PIN-like protein [Planctomycetaceae bacterium]|nr:DUF5615 family PIN-like protein [Planctomycetaceae bacterium]